MILEEAMIKEMDTFRHPSLCVTVFFEYAELLIGYVDRDVIG
jgi:hypothetical protein